MKRQAQLIAIFLGVCASAAAGAVDLDLAVSNRMVEANYIARLTPTVQYDLGGMHDSRTGGWLAHASFLAIGEHQDPGMKSSIGVGARLYQGSVSALDDLALALGGQFYYRPVNSSMVGFSGYAFSAPRVLSGMDAVGMFDGALRVELEVIKPTATVYFGYRKLLVKFKDFGTTKLDSGPQIGLRISF